MDDLFGKTFSCCYNGCCYFFYRKRYANPEELEYMICQQEMEEELQEQYSRVDRIVRKLSKLNTV